MKLLFASVNREHTNEMHISYQNALSAEFDMTYFGPGFSTEEELKRGIKVVWDSGDYDAIICSFDLYLFSYKHNSIRDIYYEHRGNLSYFHISTAIQYADKILEDIISLEAIRILFYPYDTMSFFPEEWDSFFRNCVDEGFYILAPGREFVNYPKSDVLWGIRPPTDRFKNIVEEYKDKTISLLILSASEGDLFWEPIEQRYYDCVVPGNLADNYYPKRRMIQETLVNNGYRLFTEYSDRELPYINSKSRVKSHDYFSEVEYNIHQEFGSPYLYYRLRREAVVQWREQFSYSIRQSKTAYADGGNCFQLVRKFFEIPIRGTLLLCDNVTGLLDVGFIDMKNIVIVTPDNVVDKCKELFSDLSKMQMIADEGRQLVLQKHLPRHRAKDLHRSLETIKKGVFKGSEWKNGEYIIHSIEGE